MATTGEKIYIGNIKGPAGPTGSAGSTGPAGPAGPQGAAGPQPDVVIPTVTVLTDAATINLDASLGNVFAVTLGGNRTLANPTNPQDGQQIRIRVIQDATGFRTLTFGSAYNFGATGQPTLSTSAGKGDELGFEYWASSSKWVFLGAALGN